MCIETRIKLVRIIKTLNEEERDLLLQMLKDGETPCEIHMSVKHYPAERIDIEYNGKSPDYN